MARGDGRPLVHREVASGLDRGARPLRANIDRAIAGCLDRSTFLRGPETAAFEEEWAAYCGQRHAVACNSGTDALSIAAAVLRLKLRHLDTWLEMRRAIGNRYDAVLAHEGLTIPGPSLHHLYCIRVRDRDHLRAFLADRGIGSKVHWEIPLHRQDGPWVSVGRFPNAERWCESIVSLPCFPGLRPDEVDRVCEAVLEHQSGHLRRRRAA